MRKREIVVVLILAGLILSGCSSRTLPGDAIAGPQTETEPASPSFALMVDLDEDGEGLLGRPIDPASLADLPDYRPLDFGHHYVHALSPDGGTLTLITWPRGSHNRDGRLHLIDLSSWSVTTTDLTLDDSVSGLTFARDATALYWTLPTRRDSAHGMPREFRLYRYDLGSQQLREVAALPPSFIPYWGESRLLSSGSRLAIYGIPTDRNNLVEDAPHVLIVDLDTGKIAADVRLDGVTAGQMRVETAREDENVYNSYVPGLAWDETHERLYVVHADADRVTVVDLVKGAVVSEASIRPRLSLWDRLRRWLLPVAEAKMVPGTTKRAVLSPDASRLYVVGLRSEVKRRSDTEWEWREIPLGLQVIDTRDLSEIRRLDLPVSDVAVSPDGRRLLLVGAVLQEYGGGNAESRPNGLYVLDAERLETLAHLEPDRMFSVHSFSPDGRYAYVSYGVEGKENGKWTVVLQRLDLDSQKIAAEREHPGYFLDLIEASGR